MIPARQRCLEDEWMREVLGFAETGEGRPKEQLLIETMFCVYYLSKGRAVLTTRAHLKFRPRFANFPRASLARAP